MAAYLNRPDWAFQLDFTANPNDPAGVPQWLDFTKFLRSASSLTRGKQYELGTTLAADPTVLLRDVDEYLNSVNPSSPYSGNVVPYRRVLWQGMWPNGGTGNLLNPGMWTGNNVAKSDPSFETYVSGTHPSFVTDINTTGSTVNTTTPHTGAKYLQYFVVNSATIQGCSWVIPCMPGRQYTESVWVRQTSASTQKIYVDGVTASIGATTSATGAYNRIQITFLATQPTHVVSVETSGTAISGTVLIDDIQHEPAVPLNLNPDFELGLTNWTAFSGTQAISNITLFVHSGRLALQLTPDGVGTTPHSECTMAPVTAGLAYPVSAWAYSVFGTSGKPVGVRVNWYTSLGAYISTSTGTESALVGNSYTYLQQVFTAPGTAAFAGIFVSIDSTPAVGNVVYFDQVNLLPPASTFTTSGPVIYPVMAPYAERFQKVYEDNGFTGYVKIPCVDALVALSSISIATDYVNTITIQYTPDHYWSLNGGALTQAFLPGTSNDSTPNVGYQTSKHGRGTGSVPSPGSAMSIRGDSGGTGVLFAPPATNTGAGVIMTTGPLTFPNVVGTSGYSATLAAWVICTPRAFEVQTILFPAAASALSTQPPYLGVSTTGQIYASVGGTLDFAFPSLLISTDGPVITDGLPHFVVMTVVQDATNTVLRAYVDGAHVDSGFTNTTAAIGGVLRSTTTGKAVQIGGFFAYTAYEDQLQGSLAHLALWDSALTAVQILDLWNAGNGYAGILSGNQVSQHLYTYGRYAGASRISTGSTVMGPPTYSGTIDLLSDTNNTVNAELGNLWAAPDGAVVFEGRQDRFLRLASVGTLGQNAGAGNILFDDSVEFDTDPQYIYVNVRYTRNGGSTAIGGAAADVIVAGLRFFYPPFQQSVDVLTDQTAQDLANWVFYTHNGAVQRVASITFSPAENPTLWPFALGIEISQRLTATMHAPAANGGSGLTFTADFFVEQISHDNIDADAGTWDTTLWLSPIVAGTAQSAQPWILQDPTYGILGTTTKLAP